MIEPTFDQLGAALMAFESAIDTGRALTSAERMIAVRAAVIAALNVPTQGENDGVSNSTRE